MHPLLTLQAYAGASFILAIAIGSCIGVNWCRKCPQLYIHPFKFCK